MSAYNEQPDWVVASIESILGQSWNNLRLYVALDNPESSELDALLNEYAVSDKRVRYIRNQRNLGLIETLNLLIDMTEEPYIARMDADDVAKPDRLEIEMNAICEFGLDFAMGGANLMEESGEASRGRIFPRLFAEDIEQIQRYANVSVHPTWLAKADVFKSLAGYRDVRSCEDLDFVLRALQRGFRIGYVPQALIDYRLRDQSVSAMNIYVQDAKAEKLRELYRNGVCLEGDDVIEALNEIESEALGVALEDEMKSKRALDEFTVALYNGEYGKCISTALAHYATDAPFRRRFNNAIRSRMKTNAVLKRAKRRTSD